MVDHFVEAYPYGHLPLVSPTPLWEWALPAPLRFGPHKVSVIGTGSRQSQLLQKRCVSWLTTL